MSPLELVVDAVAAYRLTKLVTDDVITEPIREQIIRAAYLRHADGRPGWLETLDVDSIDADPGGWTAEAIADGVIAPKIATLITCRWCAGVWVGAAVVAARRGAPRAWQPLAEALSLAAAAALLASLE